MALSSLSDFFNIFYFLISLSVFAVTHMHSTNTAHHDTLLQANVQLRFEWILMHTGTFAVLELRLLHRLEPVLTSLALTSTLGLTSVLNFTPNFPVLSLDGCDWSN